MKTSLNITCTPERGQFYDAMLKSDRVQVCT